MAPVTEAVLTISFGEGPYWDDDEKVLYYTNFLESSINKYNPETRENIKTEIDQFPNTYTSFLIPIEGKKHRFVGALKRDIVEIEWKGDKEKAVVVRTIAKVDQNKPENVINDGKADPRGRLFTGTFGFNPSGKNLNEMILPERGSLYRMDANGEIHQLDENITISNGLAWDRNGKTFYYVDSVDGIRKYDYDIETGNISNCQKLFVPKDHGIKGICDGLTIDTDDNLWVAIYEGSLVLKIDGKTGAILQKIAIPNKGVTSLAFGGQNLDILYVTTGNDRQKKIEIEKGAALYEIKGLGVRGFPAFKAKIN
ncbi:Regucalcin [Papilio machaon]|uniref:Regucalcin n=1 Tax=Papilio machaon TaxID=76193 RepID=A0A0N1IP04_PAPMA|nr:Regucalcin [Papilio machaon]